MTEKEVSRYIDLVHRKTYILAHSGVDWKPEYALEMEQIDRELKKLRPLVDKLREEKQRRRREQWQENLTFL